jgi:GNAT superfamily N-acetyltransferase
MKALDNPILASLDTVHRDFASWSGDAVRYPREVAPFLAVREASASVDEAVAALVAPGESVYMLGIAPLDVGNASVHAYPELAQMVCDAPLADVDGPVIRALGELEREDVLSLTALVYPHYFRPRTMEMGRYFGIYEGDRLAAMIGERMGSLSAREISAVCTHPDFNGRGYARRLMAFLTNDLIARGLQPFLHVSHENTRAKVMYERQGFRLRRNIGFWSLTRRA